MEPPVPKTKAQWRAVLRARRAAHASRGGSNDLGHTDLRRHLGRFLGVSQDLDRWGGWIIAYDPLRGEVDLWPLMAGAMANFGLPRVTDEAPELELRSAVGPLEAHRYGFRQPDVTAPLIDDAEIAVVLTPGLAFDDQGYRLGFGGGFYDRLFARLGDSVVRIGICPDGPVGELPREDHDLAMHYLATPAGVIKI